MDEAKDFLHIVNEVGFPIFMASIMIAGIYFMMRWMMHTLLGKIQGLWNMVVKLIDRVRALDNSIIRMETMLRLMKEIEPDWERLGKLDGEDRRID